MLTRIRIRQANDYVKRISERIIDVLADLIIVGVMLLFRLLRWLITVALPRGIAAIATFVLRLLGTSAVTSGVVVISIMLSAVLYWHVGRPYFDREPVRIVERFDRQLQSGQQVVGKEERLRINLSCAAWGAADDMRDPQDRLAAAVTIVNVATDKGQKVEREENGKKFTEVFVDTCAVFQSFETLAVPGESFTIPRSEWSVKSALRWAGVSPQAAHDETEELLRKYMQDPKPFLKERPWLPDSRRYIRAAWKLSPWPRVDKGGMRKVMCRLHGQPDVEPEFFRLKKDPKEVCPP
ncbi:hypothetical protein A3C18_03685 [Candidatus Kaiserbacteria bacterium RIFCSPHIGHO2_02_FULL_54_11b]|uniref:Uncharacterized protein n=2 Tax=Candidatus Kaiseribacteriota TaxID=1752734 RepID=A0A1F6CPJ1_9BACT|nr:MAG: hypothetical protein A2704_02800 [Candidatus Kaiserbacteria bacterium RIFCSPHIGHO2_01_FULL_54_36b]OGG64242.1 MAG: hypothetical protein A3C18_03685 [Candidatus Kaiserbacteria bacterium RIFCSPHIGHO2_02_FULL_54_11b]